VFSHQNDKCHSSTVVISQSAISWNRLIRRTGAFGIDGTDKALFLRRTFKVCDIYRSDDVPVPFRSYRMTFSKHFNFLL
jgi:hypothetical protein